MTPPTYNVGQVLDAADCNTWFTPRGTMLTSGATSVNTTLGGITGFQAAVDATAYYEFACYVLYEGTTGADLKFQFTGPASSALNFDYWYQAVSTGTLTFSGLSTLSTTGTAQAGGASTPRGISMRGTFMTAGTSGNLALTFSQNTLNPGNPTTIMAGSSLRLIRLT